MAGVLDLLVHEMKCYGRVTLVLGGHMSLRDEIRRMKKLRRVCVACLVLVACMGIFDWRIRAWFGVAVSVVGFVVGLLLLRVGNRNLRLTEQCLLEKEQQ